MTVFDHINCSTNLIFFNCTENTRKQKNANVEKKPEELAGSEAKDLQSTLVPGTETWQSGLL